MGELVRESRRSAWRRAGVPGWLVIGASLLAGGAFVQSAARAQTAEIAWYRVVNVGLSAGTMERYQPLGEGYAGTFPFMEGFEIRVRPEGDQVSIAVLDGTSVFLSFMSCTRPNAPRRASVVATRSTQGSARIGVDVRCSATEPPVQPASPAH